MADVINLLLVDASQKLDVGKLVAGVLHKSVDLISVVLRWAVVAASINADIRNLALQYY
jgi:hypothetical protein